MEFFRDPKIDFMKYRKFWIVISLALLLVGIVAIFVHGKLNLGIDFAGGTQLTLRFHDRPEVDDIRSTLDGAGLGDALIQRFGETADNEVMIKTPTLVGSEEGSRDKVVKALEAKYNTESDGKLDLNRVGAEEVASLLLKADPMGLVADKGQDAARARYQEIAEAVIAVRQKEGIISSWDQIKGAEGVPPAAVKTLESQAGLGGFSVIAVENVGPQIGRELRTKGVLAVVMSLLGMLVYIWVRFELRFGIGALMASIHDVLITLGLFALMGFEFNLTTIAAFLTLVGYSVNDTVVIFDRVRENMRKNRREPLVEVMNRSINQTLSRTLLTSGTTFLAVVSLLVLGGDVIRGFAFVMTVGVIVGTYSSIYIASPFALLWEQIFGRQGRARRKSASPAQSKAS